MHEDLVTPGGDSDVAADPDPLQPTRPITPLVRLGAPVVGDLEPPVAAAPSEAVAPEPSSDEDEPPAPAPVDTSVLRRAALLRLVGLGRARAMR